MIGLLRPLRRMLSSDAEARVRARLPIYGEPSEEIVLHCPLWKTASQWARLVIFDPRILSASGFRPHTPQDPSIGPEPIPPGSICSPVYWDYQTIQGVVPDSRRIRVVRRPESLFASWVHSNLVTHPLNPEIERRRSQASKLSVDETWDLMLDEFEEIAHRIRSWPADCEKTVTLRFEELVSASTGPEVLSQALRSSGIQAEQPVVEQVFRTYSQKRMQYKFSRSVGKYSSKSPGELWNSPPPRVTAAYAERYSDLDRSLGYA